MTRLVFKGTLYQPGELPGKANGLRTRACVLVEHIVCIYEGQMSFSGDLFVLLVTGHVWVIRLGDQTVLPDWFSAQTAT